MITEPATIEQYNYISAMATYNCHRVNVIDMLINTNFIEDKDGVYNIKHQIDNLYLLACKLKDANNLNDIVIKRSLEDAKP